MSHLKWLFQREVTAFELVIFLLCYFLSQLCSREYHVRTDRQTDILLTEIKVITDLFLIVIREIYVHVYTRMLVCSNHIRQYTWYDKQLKSC